MIRSRRWILGAALAATGLAGCRLYSDPEPVVIGGAAVSPEASVMTALRNSSRHRRFVAALERAGVAEILERGDAFYTVFAPSDDAYEMIRPKAAIPQLEEPDFLKQTLRGHIVAARLTREDIELALPQLNGRTKIIALNNQVLRITGGDEALRILDTRNRSARITVMDAVAQNGIVHVIDGLMLPGAETVASP